MYVVIHKDYLLLMENIVDALIQISFREKRKTELVHASKIKYRARISELQYNPYPRRIVLGSKAGHSILQINYSNRLDVY